MAPAFYDWKLKSTVTQNVCPDDSFPSVALFYFYYRQQEYDSDSDESDWLFVDNSQTHEIKMLSANENRTRVYRGKCSHAE